MVGNVLVKVFDEIFVSVDMQRFEIPHYVVKQAILGEKLRDSGAAEILKAQRWSGNIRELQNVIEKAVILSEARTLTANDIQIDASGHSSLGREFLAEDEERLVRQAMDRTGGNISAAAKMLGVSRPTLYAKLKKFGL